MGSIVSRTLAFAALAALLFVPLEHVFGGKRPARSGLATDLLFATAGETLARAGLVVVVATLLAAIEPLAPDRAWLPDTVLGRVLEVALGLLVVATCGYAFHRASHSVPFLWRLHTVHHTSSELDWLATFRRHPLEVVLTTIVQNAPVVLLGIPLGAHVGVIVLLRINSVFVHSNLRVSLGPLRHVLVSPSFHRRHHARHGEPKNFSSIFPFLDRLFGTAADDDDAEELGLDEPMPASFLGLLAHPFRARTPQADHR